jgi:hypothetical protein
MKASTAILGQKRGEKLLEKDIEGYGNKQIAKHLGGWCPKWQSQNMRSVPDRIVFIPGYSARFIEYKAPGKKATKLQLECHKRLRDLGHRVDVIDTKEGVDLYVQEHKIKLEDLL